MLQIFLLKMTEHAWGDNHKSYLPQLWCAWHCSALSQMFQCVSVHNGFKASFLSSSFMQLVSIIPKWTLMHNHCLLKLSATKGNHCTRMCTKWNLKKVTEASLPVSDGIYTLSKGWQMTGSHSCLGTGDQESFMPMKSVPDPRMRVWYLD